MRAAVLAGSWLLLLAGCRPEPVASAPVVAPTAGPTAVAADDAARPDAASAEPVQDRCVGDSARALSLLPASAPSVVELDLWAIVHLPVFLRHHAALIPGDLQPLLEAASACGLGFESWRMLTASLGGPAQVSVLQAEGIGEPDRLACVVALLPTDGGPQYALDTVDGRTRITSDDGGVAWVVDRCTLVAGAAEHDDELQRLVSGQARSVLGANTLSAAWRRLPSERQIAFVSHSVAVPAVPNPLDAELAIAIRLRGGLELDASLQVRSTADAELLAAALRREWDTTGRMIGLPQAFVDSADIHASGSIVRLDARATPAQFEEAIAGLVRTLGGGAPPPAGP